MSSDALITEAPSTRPAVPEDIAPLLVDPAAYADGRIFEAYRRLRREAPLAVAHLPGFSPFWVVTRHADILEVSRQNDLFHNGDRAATLTSDEMDARVRAMTGGSPHLVRSLVQMDPPDHPKFRTIAQAWFLPANLRKLEDRVREIARAAVDDFAARAENGVGRCDFVRDVALLYPLHVIMEILGVPREDEPRMLMLTQELFGNQDPEARRESRRSQADDGFAAIAEVVSDFYNYFEAISAERRAHPLGDLATVLANAQVDGQPISGIDLLSYYVIIATAGHDTTSSSTAGAVWQLCENPEWLPKLKADPSLIPGLVDEAIRWTTPVKHFMRTATEDAELAGQKIAKGDWLMLCYASGNRDEAVFDDPDVFRPDRKPNKHIAFGYGAHLCLGQHLAKLEMRIFFEELLARVESFELDGEPKNTQAVFVNGPWKLPIRFRLS